MYEKRIAAIQFWYCAL